MGQRLFLVSMIRNEADILGQFLLHCAEVFDQIIIVDHNSTDNSDKVIQSFQLKGMALTKFNFRYRGYYQSLISTEVSKRCFDEGADWFFSLMLMNFSRCVQTTGVTSKIKPGQYNESRVGPRSQSTRAVFI
jgi:Glycosyl transferase family 2